MSGEELRTYDREEFLGEFFPDPEDRAEIAAGIDQLRAGQRACRLASAESEVRPEPRRPLTLLPHRLKAGEAGPGGHYPHPPCRICAYAVNPLRMVPGVQNAISARAAAMRAWVSWRGLTGWPRLPALAIIGAGLPCCCPGRCLAGWARGLGAARGPERCYLAWVTNPWGVWERSA